MIDDPAERRRIAVILGRIVDELAREHVRRKTQEPALTARIGQALETALNIANSHVSKDNHEIVIVTQDVPDRGKGSLEKASGIDLYVNITVRGPNAKSKAIIIQAKKGRSRNGVDGQCKKMLKCSESSYGWFYTPDGVIVIDADEILSNPNKLLRKLNNRTSEDVFEKILKCSEGDQSIGIPPWSSDNSAALGDILNKLRASSGASFTISETE